MSQMMFLASKLFVSKEASFLLLCCADVVQSLPKSSTLNSSLYMVYSGFDEYFLNLYHNGLTPAETLKTVGDVVKAIVSALEVSGCWWCGIHVDWKLAFNESSGWESRTWSCHIVLIFLFWLFFGFYSYSHRASLHLELVTFLWWICLLWVAHLPCSPSTTVARLPSMMAMAVWAMSTKSLLHTTSNWETRWWSCVQSTLLCFSSTATCMVSIPTSSRTQLLTVSSNLTMYAKHLI